MKDIEKLGKMDIKKLVVVMSLPAIVSMIVQGLYNIIDSMFIGAIGEKALTALSFAFPVQLVIIAVFVGLGIGINSYISRKFGEGNMDDAVSGIEHGILIALTVWLLIAISSFFLPQIFVKLFTDDPVIIDYAVDYLSIVMFFSVGIIIGEVCMNILRAFGDSMSSMKIQLLGAGVNLILDPILIFGCLFIPAMGVKGAAIATVIGQIIAMVYAIYLIVKADNNVKLSMKGFCLNKTVIKDIFSVGIPAMLMTGLGSVMLTGINFILIIFSATSIAIFGIFFKIQSFVFMPVYGLCQGIMPIIGFNYGAGNKERIRKTIKYGLIGTISVQLLGTIICVCFPTMLLSMFSSTSEMDAIGVSCIRICSIAFCFAGVSMFLQTFFQATGKAIYSLIILFNRQIVILLVLAYTLGQFMGLMGVWVAFPITEFLCALLSIVVFKKVSKNMLGVKSKQFSTLSYNEV